MKNKARELQISESAICNHWDRRAFLVALSVAPIVFTSRANQVHAADMRSSSLNAADQSALQKLLSPDEMNILSRASLAPSGHNTQPWVVHVQDRGHWRIGTDKRRWLPAVDPANRETTLSIGAFLENLVVAAEHLGYGVEYQVIANATTDADLVDVRLRKGKAIEYPLARLETRRTVRTGYANEPIKDEDIRSATEASTDFVYFARDTQPAQYLASATIDANRKQAFRDAAQEELANWIRWSKKDQEHFRNGLTPAGMEIKGLAGWYVGAFYNRNAVLKKSFREASVKQVVERVAQGGGWLVQTGSANISELIETGRKFQRMWLKLREHGIAIHPMTQVLEETANIEDVSRELGVNATPQFILRIGYVKTYPKPVSPRMPFASFTSSA